MVTPLETRTLSVVEARYNFISQLPIKEALHIRGQRLNTTPAEKRGIAYSASTTMTVSVKRGGCVMDVELIQTGNEYDEDLVLVQGEIRSIILRFTNRGTTELKEVWITVDPSVTLWIDGDDSETTSKLISSLAILLLTGSIRSLFLGGYRGISGRVSYFQSTKRPASHTTCFR